MSARAPHVTMVDVLTHREVSGASVTLGSTWAETGRPVSVRISTPVPLFNFPLAYEPVTNKI